MIIHIMMMNLMHWQE